MRQSFGFAQFQVYDTPLCAGHIIGFVYRSNPQQINYGGCVCIYPTLRDRIHAISATAIDEIESAPANRNFADPGPMPNNPHGPPHRTAYRVLQMNDFSTECVCGGDAHCLHRIQFQYGKPGLRWLNQFFNLHFYYPTLGRDAEDGDSCPIDTRIHPMVRTIGTI